MGGIIAGFAFQVIYNVTMSAGLAPVKGLTLPLMSYGGLVDDRDTRRFRPDPQREDAQVHQLSAMTAPDLGSSFSFACWRARLLPDPATMHAGAGRAAAFRPFWSLT